MDKDSKGVGKERKLNILEETKVVKLGKYNLYQVYIVDGKQIQDKIICP